MEQSARITVSVPGKTKPTFSIPFPIVTRHRRVRIMRNVLAIHDIGVILVQSAPISTVYAHVVSDAAV